MRRSSDPLRLLWSHTEIHFLHTTESKRVNRPLYIRAERTLLSIYTSIYHVYLTSTPLPRGPRAGSDGPRPGDHTARAAYTVAAWSHHEGGHGRERHRAQWIIDLLQGGVRRLRVVGLPDARGQVDEARLLRLALHHAPRRAEEQVALVRVRVRVGVRVRVRVRVRL